MLKKSLFYLILFIVIFSNKLYSQNFDSLFVRNIYSEELSSKTGYDNLRYLCKEIGGRICGSPQSLLAVKWVEKTLKEMSIDKVFLQETKVRNWVRGEKEIAYISSKSLGKKIINVCALGGSIGTGKNGIQSSVIEVHSFEELEKLGKEKIEGKIVFLNRPADPKFFNTFNSYGSAADQRWAGAFQSAKYGAIGVIVRSVTLAYDDNPHTGSMGYIDSIIKIPAIAVSTKDADILSQMLIKDNSLELFFRTTCIENPEVISYNVIGEIKGSEYPDEIILIGGHLDSWDTGEGAHDDGAGVIHSLEVLRVFKTLNIIPKHTIRFVAFMDEELGQRGGKTYAEFVKNKNEKHIVAIESDEGSDTPFGFTIDGTDEQVNKIIKFKELLYPYGLYRFEKGGSGVDVWFLKNMGFPLIGLVTDSQRYFDYHHSPNDKFENVNSRCLQLCSASMVSLVYLIDLYY